jgi:hypothetical protein
MKEKYEIVLENLFEIVETAVKKFQDNSFQVSEEFEKNERELMLQAEKNEFFAAGYVKNVFNLSNTEWLCFLISALKELKQSDLPDPIKLALDIYSSNNYTERKKLENKMNSLCFGKNGKIDPHLLDFIMTNGGSEPVFNEIKVFFPNSKKIETEREKDALKIAEIQKKFEKIIYFFIKGEEGIGKKTFVKRIAQIADTGLVTVNLEECENPEYNFGEIMTAVFRETLLVKGYLCFDNFDLIKKNVKIRRKFIFKNAKNFTKFVFFLSRSDITINFEDKNIIFLNINLENLTPEQTKNIWDIMLEKAGIPKIANTLELANVFNFVPGRIKKISDNLAGIKLIKEKISKKDVSDAVRASCKIKFQGNARRVITKYGWNDLILAKDEKQTLRNACARRKLQSVVFGKWKIGRKIEAQGLSLLFSGLPGTGKTMAAGVIAKELGLDLYRVDLSQLISKYIGETEKNLNVIFNEAKKCSVILLFDEMDALFSRRTEIKNSHDRGSNIEISYLLQKMDEFDGVCIMTTNLMGNIDKAFFRRITYVINFALPNRKERKKIWLGMFPKGSPLEKDIDFDFLSKFEIAGGTIKNAAISAAFLAARQKCKINMKHMLLSVSEEFKKQGNNLISSDFGEYSYILK